MSKYEVDLHTHSHYSSDGTLTVQELTDKASKGGLKGIVFTDHHTSAGMDQAVEVIKRAGLLTCQGIEINTKYEEMDIHILGYSFAFNKKVLDEGLRSSHEAVEKRCRAIIEKVNAAGIATLTYEEVKTFTPTPFTLVSKVVIAKAIAAKRNISIKEALAFLRRDGPAYVPYTEDTLTPAQGVQLIKDANGLPVLAHPGDFTRRSSYGEEESLKRLHALLDKIGGSLFGIETYYSRHTPEQIKLFAKIARQRNLYSTGGSDWHGAEMSKGIELGDGGLSLTEAEEFFKIVKNKTQP